jgi:hypothetical protein
MPRSPASERTALIAAHPGHEALLHHWVEKTRPIVFLLTDGSGGEQGSRIDYSRRLLEAAGARCGAVFGEAPDRLWYRDLVHNDSARFVAAVERIAADCAAQNVSALISDPVELFNPIHDLANAIAHAVAHRLARTGRKISLHTYPIERPNAFPSETLAPLALNADAARRKDAAILAYRPLTHEYPRYRALATARSELIAGDEPGFSWPERTPEEPYYERFGRQRLHERRYNTLIAYGAHVRPMALRILETAA